MPFELRLVDQQVNAPARVFAERARLWLASPSPRPWNAVTTLETK